MIIRAVIIAIILLTINQRTEVIEAKAPMRTNRFMQDERELEEMMFVDSLDWGTK